MPEHTDARGPEDAAARPERQRTAPRERLVDPIPRPRADRLHICTRPAVERVVLVDNGKPNSMAILRGAQTLLRARGIEVAADIPTKASAGVPLDDALLEHLAQERGLVLLGVND